MGLQQGLHKASIRIPVENGSRLKLKPSGLEVSVWRYPFTRLPSGSLEIRPWRPILFFVGRSRGLPENPWGGKSMGWEIFGKSMDNSRVFGNSDFDKKSRFENKLAVFHKVLNAFENLYNV